MTQQTVTMLRLREMILRGELAQGERVTEADVASRLGVSRTPIRQALPALALEGLLTRSGQRGYAVRAFKPDDSRDALRLRAVLEGYAARLVAERGVDAALLTKFRQCLTEGDALFASRKLAATDEARYGDMNARFHALVLESSGVNLLPSLAARCNVVPFAGPDHIAFVHAGPEAVFDRLFHAHRQHHSIVDAIATGQGDRAEFLFREHAINQEHSVCLGPHARDKGVPCGPTTVDSPIPAGGRL